MTERKGVDWAGTTVINSTELEDDAIQETHEAAVKAKQEADETRAYVLERFRKLLGCDLPVEITSVQNLPGHNCLIVNDLLLLSYVEAKALLEQINDD